MTQIKQISKFAGRVVKDRANINWFPGHMYSGMQAMLGKLNTVDCIVEVHDARIPFTGRNSDLRNQLGSIKPRILVLNKCDLADLTRWPDIEQKLFDQGDENVILTDLSGSDFSFQTRGYTSLLDKVMQAINQSDRYNRAAEKHFKIMIVGIPNVGKSTLVNRLRQQHLGLKGKAAKTGSRAGVTKHVENVIKICARPPIYSYDTPGILKPGCTKNHDQAMKLALCANINDKALDLQYLVGYLLKYLNKKENFSYVHHHSLDNPVDSAEQLYQAVLNTEKVTQNCDKINSDKSINELCWKFLNQFRIGLFGKVMFD